MARSREHLNRVAKERDAVRAGFLSDSVRAAILDALDVAAGRVAVDLGAGTGFVTEALLARGLFVIAIDQSADMLAMLRRRIGDRDVHCLIGEAENLPIEDGCVDYVIANVYLHDVNAPATAIREAIRVLKPGGALALSDLDEHYYTLLQREQLDHSPGFTRDDVRQWLVDGGLEEIEVGSVGSGCKTDSSDGQADASIGVFLATARKPAAA